MYQALSCRPPPRGGQAPEVPCQTIPEVDWKARWPASCSALLGGRRYGGVRASKTFVATSSTLTEVPFGNINMS